MNAPTHAGATARPSPLARTVRYLYRVPMLLWHLLVDLPVVLLLITPPTRHLRWNGEPFHDRMVRAWAAGLLRVFGMRGLRVGEPLPGGVMFVANHVSWLDIIALHSQRMMGFVAKREIRGWPLVGWMAERGQTIFHARGDTESLGGVLREMLARLRSGRAVGVFPEGGTRAGDRVGPFHARIFLAAVEAGAAVQPVALRYGAGGRDQQRVAFGRRENFLSNFLRLLGEPGREVEVHFLEPIAPGAAEGRRRIAELARSRIVEVMEN
ncbi:lysophospholipid acyltransferase family protein [Novilysobacter defluvii]|uniref:Acetyltransferase n=1 Tax=Lysobacter defluvii IMMIB APB-9 = DSM 18482 TaxID=1385515 RepID=A0A0A0M499_9GAMM|nr:lysophospholipid acyltransferase family protein [Lysobacter defluvii]KGO97925.1 acetyltransferase [Lysobacter defluvii IMMIB APB-9 = DSM 18482]